MIYLTYGPDVSAYFSVFLAFNSIFGNPEFLMHVQIDSVRYVASSHAFGMAKLYLAHLLIDVIKKVL